MAKVAKPKKEISMEEALWKSADKLRGSVEPAEYRDRQAVFRAYGTDRRTAEQYD